LASAALAKAFRGELVDPDPDDEPTEVLLKRIMKEKERVEGLGRKKVKL
jgi:type I restriction enzyme S subunit